MTNLSGAEHNRNQTRVEQIAHGGELMCILIRATPSPEMTMFYTPSDSALQVGHVVYPSGSALARHSHRQSTRSVTGTPEVLQVQTGRVSFDLYSDDQKLVCTREIAAGDTVVFLAGGHGFRFIDDTILLEVKQGPYAGEQEKVHF
jgi:hypothetical protein